VSVTCSTKASRGSAKANRHPTRRHPTGNPRLDGKVERSHRIDAEEFYRMLSGVVIDDTKLFNEKLQEIGSVLQPPASRSFRRPDAL